MKKILITAFVSFAFPGIVWAAGGFATREEGSHFFIEGGCAQEKVEVGFFSKAEDKNPAYATEVACENGKFSFSGDLLKKKLASGNYILAVDGEKSQNVVSVKNEDYGKGEEAQPPTQSVETTSNLENPETKFLEALVSFEKSVLDMRAWLSKTRYPEIIKKSLDSALDGIEELSGKIADLLWSADNATEKKEGEILEEENRINQKEAGQATEETEAILEKESTDPAVVEPAKNLSTENSAVSPRAHSAEVIENLPENQKNDF